MPDSTRKKSHFAAAVLLTHKGSAYQQQSIRFYSESKIRPEQVDVWKLWAQTINAVLVGDCQGGFVGDSNVKYSISSSAPIALIAAELSSDSHRPVLHPPHHALLSPSVDDKMCVFVQHRSTNRCLSVGLIPPTFSSHRCKSYFAPVSGHLQNL